MRRLIIESTGRVDLELAPRIAGGVETKDAVVDRVLIGLGKWSFVAGDSLQPKNAPRCLDSTARMLRFVQAYCDY